MIAMKDTVRNKLESPFSKKNVQICFTVYS